MTRINLSCVFGYPILISLLIIMPINNQMTQSERIQKSIDIQIRLGKETSYYEGKISAEEFYGKVACECRANGIEVSQQLEDEWKYGTPQSDYIYLFIKTYLEYREVDPDLSVEDFHKIFTGKSTVN